MIMISGMRGKDDIYLCGNIMRLSGVVDGILAGGRERTFLENGFVFCAQRADKTEEDRKKAQLAAGDIPQAVRQ